MFRSDSIIFGPKIRLTLIIKNRPNFYPVSWKVGVREGPNLNICKKNQNESKTVNK